MRALIDKRTHTGDPSPDGAFGVHGCRGQVRDYAYDVVIGVGGIGRMPVRQNLAGKINWIGRNPIRTDNPIDRRGSRVSFKPEDFRLFEDRGPALAALSPILGRKIHERRGRFVLSSLNVEELREVAQRVRLILDLKRFDHLQVSHAGPSPCPTHSGLIGKTDSECNSLKRVPKRRRCVGE